MSVMTGKQRREDVVLLVGGVACALFGTVLLGMAVVDLVLGEPVTTTWQGLTAMALGTVFLLIRRVDALTVRVRVLEDFQGKVEADEADEADAAWRDSLPDVAASLRRDQK